MNVTNIVALNYQKRPMEALVMGGQMWLRGAQLAPPLGYASERRVRELHERNADEFTSDETRVVTLPSDGGLQQTRVFSLRGARLLALLARTPEAKAFRRWVLDVLEGRVRRQPAQTVLDLPGTHRLPTETVRALDEAAAMLEEGSAVRALLTELRDGMRPLSHDPLLDDLVQQLAAARAMHGEANRAYRAVARRAEQAGYSLDGVKAAAKQVRDAA